ncbi:tRNA 2-selenouridine(34) synthase MnmH [Profundibacterium mesophilum]|uniref:Ubiquitin-activating enzyme E1 C n=1 Tax=Profundibacterium mesophilum KAUST100406-0324 TaxID=1037889 RepID=A0A921NY92_9RHOB|nr:tRNA 2-selenouridine(34) synthase MnmH [Profundibacterium mesophilum]KAF0677575.1 ubiquitin-activating enzyme E1 C [Profundibacterium mesophilum KAUST100406-0324]
MAHRITTLAALAGHDFDQVIDVRAPAEFAEDHLPGAINLPVLSDEERARVGTIYVQQSPFLARKVGAALVARNAAAHIEGPLADLDGAWRPLVYCWRGGQRSNSFASILTQVGWRAEVIEGGYRSYRHAVKSVLYDTPMASRVILLDGYTGTAKTEILHRAAEQGAQVLDLEGLANHRGSVFGAREGGQPEQKGFESALAARIIALDASRPVLVEAESSRVGACNLPPQLWAAMRAAPRIEVVASPAARARYLVEAYTDIVHDGGRLDETLSNLVRLQGHEQVAAWRALARAGQFERLAGELMERHYDPRYARQRGRDAELFLDRIETDALDRAALERIAGHIAARMRSIEADGAP